ncbi:molybdopterin-dependent oxidoreductase [Gordonibacter sp.]|uniref:molybdopterin-dependent oxidoreductase n=1 Tax=Gordonibacter sp. TaxID=1968902 RepID=UPI0025B91866|nr:molybdopterin-dependent oxidoreductase [Gordonibacter sp.]
MEEGVKTCFKNTGFCNFTWGSNAAEVDVKDGKILRIRPLRFDKAYERADLNPWRIEARGTVFEPKMCSLLPPYTYAYKKRVYSPNRILYPLKRVDWDPRGDRHPETRGTSKFERISWDEATDLIAAELLRIREEYGPYAVLVQGDGHGETKVVHGPHGCQTKLLELMGGYTLQARNPDSWEGWYWGSKHAWGFEALGQSPQNNLWLDVAEYTDLILFWGSDPETTSWGWSGLMASRTCYWFEELGIKSVYICPDLNYAAAIHADKWIPVLPGTDAALQLALAYVWLDEGLYDQEYVRTHTVGFDEFAAYVRGDEDGEPKSPAWAAPKCGVPEYTIKALAREWAKMPTAIARGNGGGMARSSYSHEPARLEVCLLAMQAVGAPGRCQLKMGEWNGDKFPGPRPAVDPNLSAAGRGWHFSVPPQFVPKTLVPEALTLPEGEQLTWYGTTLFPWPKEDQFVEHHFPITSEEGGGPIHMVWTDSPCWTTCWNNGNALMEALRDPRIETVVAQHIWMENDCLMADIILPINTKFEERDIGNDVFSGQFASVLYEDQCIEPLGESKSDWEAVGEVAKKLGLYDAYVEGKSLDEWMEYAFATSGVQELVSYDELREKGYYPVPTREGWWADTPRGMRAFYEDPENNPLDTPSGKIEFVSENLKTVFPDDEERPPLPHWIPFGKTQQESLLHERARAYPFLLVSNHPRWRLHAELDDVTWFREIDTCKVVGPDGYRYEPVWINPVDAERLGIAHGDVVALSNERGVVLGGAYVTPRIMPGALYQDHGARLDPIELGVVDRGGANNLICPSSVISEHCAGEVTSSFLVTIGKADLETLRSEHPEAFERPYDKDAGLLIDAWMTEGEM